MKDEIVSRLEIAKAYCDECYTSEAEGKRDETYRAEVHRNISECVVLDETLPDSAHRFRIHCGSRCPDAQKELESMLVVGKLDVKERSLGK